MPLPTRNLTGQKFSSLTALKFLGYRKKRALWTFQCDCGRVKEIVAASVLSGTTKACGCLNGKNNRSRLAGSTPRESHSAKKALMGRYKRGAKDRSIEWNLAEDDFYRIVDEPCHYCGDTRQSRYSVGKKYYCRYTGIDRKNSADSYSVENCLPCCKKCNRAKSDLDYEVFKEWVKKVYLQFCEFGARQTATVN